MNDWARFWSKEGKGVVWHGSSRPSSQAGFGEAKTLPWAAPGNRTKPWRGEREVFDVLPERACHVTDVTLRPFLCSARLGSLTTGCAQAWDSERPDLLA